MKEISEASKQSPKPLNELLTNEVVAERLRQFDATSKSAQRLLFIARDASLQRAAIGELQDLSKEVEVWKGEAVRTADEDKANLFLGMICALHALSAELEMWLLLKAEDPEAAWDRLIDAQTATSDTLRAHPAFSQWVDSARRLARIEKLVYPPQVFLSAGLVVHTSVCSICGSEYGTCAHVVGMPYMGELCRRILRDVVPDHVAIVDEPANKRCRVTHFTNKEGRRNRMTWRLDAGTQSLEQDEAEGLKAEGRIISASDFES